MPLSFSIKKLLSPWFQEKTLAQAETELAATPRPQLIYYRHGGGTIFPAANLWCAVLFEEAPQIPQGFRLIQPHCSQCGPQRKVGDYCRHLAVLTVLALRELDGNLWPAPLLYKKSLWHRLAGVLANQAGTPRIVAPGYPMIFSGHQLECAYQAAPDDLDPLPIMMTAAGLPSEAPIGKELAIARDHLLENTRSTTEKELNSRGRKSQGQSVDHHPWSWLGRALFLRQPEAQWASAIDANQRLTITTRSEGALLFSLTPARELCWPLLRLFADRDLCAELAPARGYARLGLDPQSHQLQIDAWVELSDGRRLPRAELEPFRYDQHYSFDGRHFFTISDWSGGLLSPEMAKSAQPLFALAANRERPLRRIVAADKVPAFLAEHRQTLANGEHEIDPALANLVISDLPDGLNLSNFREEGDWCYLAADFRLAERLLSLTELLQLKRQGAEYAAAGGKWLRLRDSPLAWLLERELVHDEDGDCLRLTHQELFTLCALLPEIASPTRPQLAETLKRKMSGAEVALSEADLPPYLRDYQKKGVGWLYHLFSHQIGALLADDMGLGKTHQALAFLALVKKSRPAPALIVCPASLLPHWADKLTRFYPELPFLMHYGLSRQSEQLRQAPLILTTYGILRRDIDDFAGVAWAVVVYDEIGQLRNQQTETAKAATRLTTGTVLGLTGTPVENSLGDLKGIFSFCVPGLFRGDRAFERTFRRPIEEEGDQGRRQLLARLIAPFILRRTRQQVLPELPPLTEDIRYCRLSRQQQDLYRQAIEGRGQQLAEEIAADTAAPLPYFQIIAVLQYLKQICNHPSQLAGSTDYAAHESGKWELFTEILAECLASKLKVVVFSQYTTMLDIIEHYLRDQAIPYRGLRGSMPPATRQRHIEAFNKDPEVVVFTASLLAGGVGIDLTSAQVVIHYDRWWTAAKEEQASARVHRLGQQQPVQVVKFISQESIEEKIHQLIERKAQLADDLLSTDDVSLLKRLNRQEILELLGGQEAGVFPG